MSNKTKNIENFKDVTQGYFNVPIEGNDEADEIWKILFKKNFEHLKDKAHSLFFKGLKELSMDSHKIPNLKDLEVKIKEKTDWSLVPTDNEYSGAEDWFFYLTKKSFPITKVIRSKENLDYTPYPEAFHDLFGHMPFMCSKEVMNLVHKAALVYQKIESQNEKEKFWNFWWYTIEFGLIKENGEIKVLGAGFMSSFGECSHAFSDKVVWKKFDVEEMKNTKLSDHEFHNKFFVIDSFEQIESALDNWFN